MDSSTANCSLARHFMAIRPAWNQMIRSNEAADQMWKDSKVYQYCVPAADRLGREGRFGFFVGAQQRYLTVHLAVNLSLFVTIIVKKNWKEKELKESSSEAGRNVSGHASTYLLRTQVFHASCSLHINRVLLLQIVGSAITARNIGASLDKGSATATATCIVRNSGAMRWCYMKHSRDVCLCSVTSHWRMFVDEYEKTLDLERRSFYQAFAKKPLPSVFAWNICTDHLFVGTDLARSIRDW